MKNIFKICFEYTGRINRKEYFLGNLFLIFLSLMYAFICLPLLIQFTIKIPGMGGIIAPVLPLLIVFSYSSFCLILQRGKDFKAHSFFIYLFFGIVMFTTWGPVITFLSPELMLQKWILLSGMALNLAGFIGWVIFQSIKTK